MKIPKYVQELISLSEYNYSVGDAGYTLDIHKPTRQTLIPTFKSQIQRLVKWANRQVPQNEDGSLPTAEVLHIPTKTHYRDQVATVTIYDPVMQKLEPFLGKELERRRRSTIHYPEGYVR